MKSIQVKKNSLSNTITQLFPVTTLTFYLSWSSRRSTWLFLSCQTSLVDLQHGEITQRGGNFQNSGSMSHEGDSVFSAAGHTDVNVSNRRLLIKPIQLQQLLVRGLRLHLLHVLGHLLKLSLRVTDGHKRHRQVTLCISQRFS